LRESGASRWLGIISIGVGFTGLSLALALLLGAFEALAGLMAALAGLVLISGRLRDRFRVTQSCALVADPFGPVMWETAGERHAVKQLAVSRWGSWVVVQVETQTGRHHMLSALPQAADQRARICAWIVWVSGRAIESR
jgi:hypothetical protein